ncbi:MAG: prepilin-type N-terminal cleavage/methylation domain-containing protein [Candidatus Levybacteria bacterium]|nr:prepilin-type N-terminal cleavage/methylation domain-containing protein [Candidatus Levybacteria bacterium]
MKNLPANFRHAAGFTLIELLVVIGILGILASALVATINPFEQLNKAQDSNLKNASVEFLNANIRYFTTHNAMPWDSVADGGAGCYGTSDLSAIALSTLGNCLTTLLNEGEIKQGFTTFNGLDKIFITEPSPQTSSQNDTTVCFMPVSKSQQTDPTTVYAQDGSTGANCKSTGGNNNCYWCAQ